MITRCSKKDFIELVKSEVSDDGYSRVENFLREAEKHHFYRIGDEVGDEPTEDEFFDYLYSSFKVLQCDVDKFISFLISQNPSEIISPDPSPLLSKERFETVIWMRFGSKSANEILSLCGKIVRESNETSRDRLYADFYLTLFVCGFQKDLFLRNLANHYQMRSYVEALVKQENGLEHLDQVISIENEIRATIQELLPSFRKEFEKLNASRVCNKERIDMLSNIISVLSNQEFPSKMAWLIVDLFPDASLSEYEVRIQREQNMLQEYSKIASWKPDNKPEIWRVVFEFGNANQNELRLSFSDPYITKQFGQYLAGYFRTIKSIPDENFCRSDKESLQGNLRQRLVRRTALLFCCYGLIYKDAKKINPDMWYMQNSEIRYASFHTTYGSLMFDLLAGVNKCYDVLFNPAINPKADADRGIYPKSNKAKWDALKARVRNIPGRLEDLPQDIKLGIAKDWQDLEIKIDLIPHLPFSLLDQ